MWSDFYGTFSDDDPALAQTLRAVRIIRGAPPRRAPVLVQEEIRAALDHLCAAMEAVVAWMEQGGRAEPAALELIAGLRTAGDSVARCATECPLELISRGDSSDPAAGHPSHAVRRAPASGTPVPPRTDSPPANSMTVGPG